VCYPNTQNMEVGTTFGFSLYAIFLLIILIIYSKRDIQNIANRQVHQKVGGVLSPTPEVGDSTSQFLG